MNGKIKMKKMSSITLRRNYNSNNNDKEVGRLSIITNKDNSPSTYSQSDYKTFGLIAKTTRPMTKNNLIVSSRNNMPKNKDKENDKIKALKESCSQKSLQMPKNFNSFKHLVTNTHLVFSDLDWILRLRNIDLSVTSSSTHPIKSFPYHTTSFNPPSFFKEDNLKHKSKSLHKSNSQSLSILNNPFHTTENSFKLSHLVKDIGGNGINTSMLSFETSLRDYKSFKGTQSSTHMFPWKNLAYQPKQETSRILPPVLESSKRNLIKLNKYLIKDYEKVMKRITYEGDDIVRKTMKESDKGISERSAEHNTMRKYCDNYGKGNRNVAGIEHLMKEHNNNSLTMYETSMRNYKKSNDDNDGDDYNKKKKMIMIKSKGKGKKKGMLGDEREKDLFRINLKKKII